MNKNLVCVCDDRIVFASNDVSLMTARQVISLCYKNTNLVDKYHKRLDKIFRNKEVSTIAFGGNG